MNSNAPNQQLSLKYPFIVGTIFVLLVLAIVAFGKDPSPQQFQIYRIVIALGGAGFAVALSGQLELMFKILKNGYIKAAAAFGVFVILYFFSPASLTINSNELNAKKILDEYNFQNKEVVAAKYAVHSIWSLDEYGRVFSKLGKERTKESLTAARNLIRSTFEENHKFRKGFDILKEFHGRVFQCIDSGMCDTQIVCDGMFSDVESFRVNYCDRLIEESNAFNSTLWLNYKKFSEDTCKREFLVEYVDLQDLANTCIPTQCWAQNVTPPYPCDVENQLANGMSIPSI